MTSGHPQATSRLDRWDRLLFWAVAFGVAFALVLFLSRTLADPDLWFDEAGQFWLSRGQFHGAMAGTPDAPVWSGLAYARNGYNLDPPGFTVVLAAWTSLLGSAPIALRTLPAIAFVLSIVAATVIGWGTFRLRRGVSLAIAVAVLVMPLTLSYSVEVRAYAFEVLAVLLVALALLRYLNALTVGRLSTLIAALTLGALLTRYSFVFAIAAVMGALVLAVLACGVHITWRHAASLAASIVGVGAFLAWYAKAGSGVAAPDYVTGLLLKGASRDQLLRNAVDSLLIWPHVLTALFIVTGAVGAVRWLRHRPVTGARAPVLQALGFVVVYELAAIAASTLGATPWEGASRWSIGLTSVAALSGCALASLTAQAVPRLSTAAVRAVVLAGSVAVLVLAAASAMALATRFVPKEWGMHPGYNHGFTAALALPEPSDGSDVLVASFLWPSLRYIIERSGEPVDAGWGAARAVDDAALASAVARACGAPRQPVTAIVKSVDVTDILANANVSATSESASCPISAQRFNDITVLSIASDEQAQTG